MAQISKRFVFSVFEHIGIALHKGGRFRKVPVTFILPLSGVSLVY